MSGAGRIAVGTTVVRTLERAAQLRRARGPPGRVQRALHLPGRAPISGRRCALDQFHLPDSSLIQLVAAFAGTARTKPLARSGDHYRFYSYGDARLNLGNRAMSSLWQHAVTYQAVAQDSARRGFYTPTVRWRRPLCRWGPWAR